MTPPSPQLGDTRSRWFWPTALILVSVGIIAAYSNSLNNGFHLDDLWGITPNPFVRSLKFIPRYFVDPSTYNTHAENVDYRPMASTSYAINYAISQVVNRRGQGGYDPWSWHLLNLLLHSIVCLSIVALGRTLLGSRRAAPLSWLTEREGDLVSLGAGFLFAVHPVTAGCANYMWARSSLLVAAFLAPAMVLYIRATQRDRWLPALAATLLFAAALFSKEEAIAFLAIAALAEFLLAPSRRNRPLFARFIPRLGDLRLVPLFTAAAAYLALYTHLLPPGQSSHWRSTDVTPLQYFLTQTGAWWYYVGKVFLPVKQIADYAGYAAATPRFTPDELSSRFGPAAAKTLSQLSIALQPAILCSLAAWTVVAILLVAAARRAPAITLLGASFFIFLSPTSSIVPLAEMVNEHRPYLSDAMLMILVSLGLFMSVRCIATWPLLSYAALVVALALPLTLVTRARNLVFLNELTYWEDVANKDPMSGRAQLNYALELWKIPSRITEAEEGFRKSVELWPNWFFGHVNLALFLYQQGHRDEAFVHFDRAVELGGASSIPVYYRGLNRLDRGDLVGAESDLRLAVERASVKVRERVALAKALLALKREDEAFAQIDEGLSLDRSAFAELATPLNTAGLDRMAHNELDVAERCFTIAAALDPAFDLPEINLGVLDDFRGNKGAAASHFDRATALAPGSPGPYRWRADFRERSGDLPGAIADYRVAADLDHRSTSDLVHLAELLLRTGQRDEARLAIERGESIDPGAFKALRSRLNAP
jgi:tetratricopeptide (TPR) repeat protein